jgi:hypothetical protein
MAGRDSHDDALNEAWGRLAGKDMAMLAKNSGAVLKPGSHQLSLRVIHRECVIDIAARTIKYAGGRSEETSAHIKILILHYIEGSEKAQLANRLVSYRDFEGGALYYQAFKTRTIDFLVREFGQKPEVLKQIGDAIRAEPMSMGSVSFKSYFFPKMPVVVVLWLGDDEVPASANLLFDANAGRIMPTEDLSILGGVLCEWLVKLERT